MSPWITVFIVGLLSMVLELAALWPASFSATRMLLLVLPSVVFVQVLLTFSRSCAADRYGA
jgi:hypothetical protein